MRKKEAIKKKAEFQVKIPPFFEYCKNLYFVREQDICDKEIKNKKELCYNASDQTNKITGDPSYETYYNRRTETS